MLSLSLSLFVCCAVKEFNGRFSNQNFLHELFMVSNETLKTFIFYTHDSPTFFLPQHVLLVQKRIIYYACCVCVFSVWGKSVTPIFKHPALSLSLKKNSLSLSLSLSLSRPLCAREDDDDEDDDEDKEDKEDETG